jgi:predicted polyphosphate/ATP-dependent NAD kinase
MNGQIVDSDVGEGRLLSLLEEAKAKLVITPIGGQGFLFGRGNQQLSPKVIRKVGRENIMVIATPQKLHSLQGGALLVDTGEDLLDRELCGPIKVVTGYRECSFLRVEC